MAARSSKAGKRKATRTSRWVWGALVLLLIAAGVLALNVSQRFQRVAKETNQLRNVVQESASRQDMILKTPARKEFSAAFLQMAFGDNPLLLDQIKGALGKAVGDKPSLSHGDIAMMLVTYRAEGELRDVAIQVFGNLSPSYLPKFSSDGFWRGQLNEQFYNIGQSGLSMLGREVLILANKEVEKRQREVLDAGLTGEYPIIRDYLHDPVSFIAVLPEPNRLFTEEFRPYMAAVLIKGKLSLDGLRAEMVVLSFDPQKARELAQMLSDLRMMALGLARLRSGGFKVSAAGFDALARMQIHADGPTVVANTAIPKEFLEPALPRFVSGLARGVGRIKKGPGYPQ